MKSLFSQTLIRIAAAAKPSGVRSLFSLSSEADATVVEKIEDAIHTYIVKRSKPDWLPFVPGGSYWVPPRRTSYGVAEFVSTLANVLTVEEHLSLTSVQGWPSSAFYLHNDDVAVRHESTDILNLRSSEG